MYHCSHLYFLPEYMRAQDITPPAVIAATVLLDLGVMANYMPSFKGIRSNCDRIIHGSAYELIALAKSLPSSLVPERYGTELWRQLVPLAHHAEMDEVFHGLCDQFSSYLHPEVSRMLHRPATHEEIASVSEMYLEARVRKQDRTLAPSIIRSFRQTKDLRPAVSAVFSSLFRRKGYDVSSGKFRTAIILGSGVSSLLLQSGSYLRMVAHMRDSPMLDQFTEYLIEYGLPTMIDVDDDRDMQGRMRKRVRMAARMLVHEYISRRKFDNPGRLGTGTQKHLDEMVHELAKTYDRAKVLV